MTTRPTKAFALALLVATTSNISFGQTYTLVSRTGPSPFIENKVYVRTVTGYDMPVGVAEYTVKFSSCTGSYNPACPWSTPWASLFSTYESLYLGYSGNVVVPSGKVYKWYFTFRMWFGLEKWSKVEDGLTLEYERTVNFDDDFSDLNIEITDVYVPPGGTGGEGG